MSINLAEDQVSEYLQNVETTGAAKINDSVCIACVNSPLNCTLSGSESAIDDIKVKADKDGIFAQKLKTWIAYHSPSMRAIAEEYLSLMGDLESAGSQIAESIPMFSSVNGKVVGPDTLAKGQYWVENMVSRVLFSDAVRCLAGTGNITDMVEIGPHPALKRPIQDTLHQAGGNSKEIRYASALQRSHSPVRKMLELVGQLFCLGHDFSITAVNQECQSAKGQLRPFLTDCPAYPFNHSQRYWGESRIGRDYRLRKSVSGELLGIRAADWNPLEPRWRSFLTTESMPWIGHHVVSNTVLFPAAGMLVMAIEAVQQMIPSNRAVIGYLVKEAHFVNPIVVPEAWEERVEVNVHLSPARRQQHEKSATWFNVGIMSYSHDRWTECCRATIQIHYQDSDKIDGGENRRLAHNDIQRQYAQAIEQCMRPVDSNVYYQESAKSGLEWGPSFQVLQDIACDSVRAVSVARVDTSKEKHQTQSLVHPAVLDVIFHMLRLSSGQEPVTNVPFRLSDAWFAASGWQSPRTNSIRWMSTSYTAGGRTGKGERGSVSALADDGSVLCSIKEAATTPVSTSHGHGENKNSKKLLHSVEWKPQLSLLSSSELAQACQAESFTKDEDPLVAALTKLRLALDLVVARTLPHFNTEAQLSAMPENFRRHITWMQRHVSRLDPSQIQEASTISDSELESRLCEAETLLPVYKCYTAVARNLSPILEHKVDPLQVVFESNLATVFYDQLFGDICGDGRLTKMLDLISHENPTLQVLEVGAGTGGLTGHVLRALQDREIRTGAPSFASYTYTDISASFLENARRRWPELQSRMTFKTLDVEKDISQQGFAAGSYDLIVAGCVLHATAELETTLKNARAMLKPGGRLLLVELIDPEDITTNFWTGVLPGWWVGRDEWRSYSAAVAENQWDASLKTTGFSGNDLVLRDYHNDKCHFLSIMLSTAVHDATEACESPSGTAVSAPKAKLLVIVDADENDQLDQQKALANSVLSHINPEEKYQASICTLSPDQCQTELADDAIVICLAEVQNKPLLTSLSEKKFQCLQQVIKQARRLLWATATATTDSAQYPHYSAVQGFLRTIRAEQPNSQLVSLSIEGQLDAATCVQNISRIFSVAFESLQPSREVEYIIRDGQVLTGRAIEDVAGIATLRSMLSPQLHRQAWKDGPALQLEVGTPGALDSLQFVEDTAYGAELGPCEVEIEAKAWGLNFRDVLIALGREDEDELGADCSGIVTRVGSDCTSLRPGDRVCMVVEGCMRQYPRAHETRVYPIPNDLPFDAAASILVPGLTAYHCIVEVARLQKGDKILIHSAAGSTGQMAVHIAQMLGVEVFATTSSAQKKKFLMDTFGIPADHIFHSRTTSFAQGVMRITQGYGVDCVLNSLSGDGLRCSFECMAPFGRFIDIGHADINANSALPMAMFSKNVSFSAVHLMWLKPSVTANLLKETLKLWSDGKIQPPQPLRVFRLPEAEQAFRYLQSGKSVGRIVIAPNDSDVVPVSSIALEALAAPKHQTQMMSCCILLYKLICRLQCSNSFERDDHTPLTKMRHT